MDLILLIDIALALFLIVFVAFLVGREFIGEFLSSIFHEDIMCLGDKIDIFIDKKYNRTASITGVKPDAIEIYNAVCLPVSYRGRFYATGIDEKGATFVYLKDWRRYRLVRVAETIRRIFAVCDDLEQLTTPEKEDDLEGFSKEEGVEE